MTPSSTAGPDDGDQGTRPGLGEASSGLAAIPEDFPSFDFTPLSWHEQASCASVGGELWFPDGGPAPQAQRICRACPVVAECLEYALTTRQEHGIWAATTPRERRLLRRAS